MEHRLGAVIRNGGSEISSRSGVTLLEMLVVAGVLIIIFTMIVPSLLRSKIAGNEASAIGSLKQIGSGQEQYKFGAGSNCYGTLSELSAGDNPYVDETIGAGKKSGYNFFVWVPPGRERFVARANPVTPDKTGKRCFYTDESGVVRYRVGGPARSTDSPLE